ncbi:MAG: aspartate--tRNA(Asn) ligase [Nanoarchaeota archaeon]
MAKEEKIERTLIKEAFEKKAGTKVRIAGWVHDSRALGKVRFLVVRDITGRIQIVGFKPETPEHIFEMMGKLNRESVVYVEGVIKDSKQAPGGKELAIEGIELVSAADEKLPIDVSDFSKTELPKRLDYRFLDLHRARVQAVFRIQTEIARSFREYFANKNYVEIQPPYIISSSSEGGTDLFPVQYFEKKGFLAQSPQLYKQMLACSMERTFTCGPAWRAEKHNTTRHINEIRMLDVEAAFMNQMEIMKEQEEFLKYAVENIIKKFKTELDLLGVKLNVPKGIYLTYEDGIKKAGGKIGEDFTPDQERKLCEMYTGDVVFVHSWPTSIKPFYIMPRGEDEKAKVSEGFDSLYGGVEISSGGQRIHIPNLLIARLKAKGLNPKSFESYIDSFRFGAPPHSGWAIGLERLTQIICGLDNVKEATMFPRDRDRLTP